MLRACQVWTIFTTRLLFNRFLRSAAIGPIVAATERIREREMVFFFFSLSSYFIFPLIAIRAEKCRQHNPIAS
jgi:hypothetical protein